MTEIINRKFRKLKRRQDVEAVNIPKLMTAFRSRSLNSENPQKTTVCDQFPLLPLQKVLNKIGGKNTKDEDKINELRMYQTFKKERQQKLRQKYFNPRSRKVKVFDCQLDTIVLGYWKYGQTEPSSDIIWRKYRQDFEQLSYKTILVTHRKRRF